MAPPPLTAARLSSLSTSILSQILELTRSTRLDLPAPSLTNSILKNLATLRTGIDTFELGGGGGSVVEDLKAQEERLIELVEALGVEVSRRALTPEGRLVETDDDGEDSDGTISGVPLHPLSSTRPAHTTVHFPDDSDDELDRMEEDEDTLRRANSEVMQMQRQMMDDQDETLDSLSSAISRQHALSLNISSELEMHEDLLSSTDEALDRTATRLQKAGNNLKIVAKKARDTGSTGLIILLVVILVLLITIFK